MMSTKKILYNKALVAQVFFSHTLDKEGVSFLTDEMNFLQVGTHNVKKGKVYPLHYHIMEKKIEVNAIQELLFVVSGKIKVSLHTKNGTFIESVILSSGDSILLIDEAHEIEILEQTKLFEIKQGPYPGVQFAKVYLS